MDMSFEGRGQKDGRRDERKKERRFKGLNGKGGVEKMIS